MFENEIFGMAFLAFNTCCTSFVCIASGRWLRRLENKVDELKAAINADVNMRRLRYVALLARLRDEAAERGDYETANELKRMINKELKKRNETA